MRDTGILKKLARYGLKAIAWFIGVTIVIWVILWIYVGLNEKRLISKVSTTISEKTRSDVKIGSLSVSFFRTFPLLSLQLSHVVLRDSMYLFHHKNLLTASDVYFRVSIPGLITGRSAVGKVIVRNGEINIVSDSLGNNNLYILKYIDKGGSDKKFSMPGIVLKNVEVNYEDRTRNKHYHAFIETLKCTPEERNEILMLEMNLKALVKNLSFNTIKGAYLKEKMVEGKFDINYNTKSNDLVLNHIRLYLDNHPFYFDGKFNLDKKSLDFNLTITARNINFSKVTTFLTDSIRGKMDKYSFMKPVSFGIRLSGKTLYKSIPLVEADMNVKHNNVITPEGMFEDCTFNAFFSNELVRGRLRDDINSYILIRNFAGRWEKILFSSKSIKISNFKKPFVECDVVSDVDLKSLNNLAGSSSLRFLKGNISVNIVFRGPLNASDSTSSDITGDINLHDASFKYLPRDFLLSDCDGSLQFSSGDLIVEKLSATGGRSHIVMSGSAKNFISLLNVSPEKLVLSWKIYSPELHLSDFKGFLSKSEVNKQDDKNAKFEVAASRIDKMFRDGDVYISLETPLLDYKTFRATNLKAKVVLKSSEIKMEQVALNHAGGSINLSGSLKNGMKNNPLILHAHMQKIDVPLLFFAFNNFGQDAITHKNLKGKLSGDVDFKTSISNEAQLITEASEGTIRFLLENGELNNFEPLQEISKKVFKKQNFTQIRFADLKNKLDVKGTAFIVNPMDIRSTALNFSVEGIYDYKKGTDMSIKLPLRNLMNSQANTDISDAGKTRKGLGLRLRAKTGEDGKLKISWDPFRLSVRNRENVKDTIDLKN